MSDTESTSDQAARELGDYLSSESKRHDTQKGGGK